MLVATILGVFMIPVLFVLVEKLSGKKKQPTTTEIPAHENNDKDV
jgi:hypothetical protein